MATLDLELLRHEVQQTTQHFSRKAGKTIRVVFGQAAATDCESTVCLPAIDENSLTPEMTRAVRGYIDHEAGGHMVFTDKAAIDALQKKPTLFSYWNGLEDPRIERLHCAQFPGAKKNITTTLSVVTREHTLPALEADPPSPTNIVEYAPVLASLLGRRHFGLTAPEADRVIDMFPPALVAQVDGFARRALHASSSHEVITIAEEMFEAMLAEEKAQQQQQQEKQDGQQDGQQGLQAQGADGGGAGDGDNQMQKASAQGQQDDNKRSAGREGGEESSKGEKESSAPGEASPEGGQSQVGAGDSTDPQNMEAKSGDGGPQSGDQSGNQHGNGAGGAARKILDPSLSQVLQHVAQAAQSNTIKVEPPTHLWAINTERTEPDPGLLTNNLWQGWTRQAKTLGRPGFQNLTKKVPSAAANMTKTLLRVLAAQQRRDRNRGLEEGRLDPRRLVQAAMGQTNVFYRPADRVDMDTFVELLVDCSSSMQKVGSLLSVALAATGAALEATGATWACHTYSGVAGQDHNNGGALKNATIKGADKYEQARGIVNRRALDIRAENPDARFDSDEFLILSIFELKGPSERLMAVSQRFAAVDRLIAGNTPTGRSILQVLPMVLARPERRKVIIVLTDGQPNGGDPFHKVAKELAGRDVSLIGIALGHGASTLGFPAAERITNLEDLAKTTLQAVWKELA